MDSAEYVGIVFFDIKKAFDRVWHDGLLEKLSSFGVKGRALKWLHSFLTGRRLCGWRQGCFRHRGAGG